MTDHPAFAEFEPGPLRELLGAVSRVLGTPVEELRPGRRLSRRAALAEELAVMGIAADLDRLHTVRALVGAVVPLLEERPRAHH